VQKPSRNALVRFGIWLRLGSGVVACALFALTWLPAPYAPRLPAFCPSLAALIVAAIGLLTSRFMLHRGEALLPRLIGTALCWTAMLGATLVFAYIELVKVAMLL
jgi:hypothetical protein